MVLTVAKSVLYLVLSVSCSLQHVMVHRELFASAMSPTKPRTSFPQVLLHKLCQIGMREFVRHLQGHSVRLLPLFGADGMDDISKEFAEFQCALREDPLPQQAIVKNTVNHVSFVEGWSPANDRFFDAANVLWRAGVSVSQYCYRRV
jgi:hypothetical protein